MIECFYLFFFCNIGVILDFVVIIFFIVDYFILVNLFLEK